MLLLVTVLLVVVAAVTLLIGIVSDNLALIFISIGASALAAIVLAVLSQVTKRKGREAEPPASSTLPVRPAAPATAASGTSIGEPAEHDVMAEEPTSLGEEGGEGATPLPIAGYGALRVNDLLPKLEGLDLDELEAVAQHEEANKNRTTILARIDELMDELEAAELAPSATALDPEVAEEAAASIAGIGEPVVAIDAGEPDDEVGRVPLPIESYDELSEDELIPMLADLDADELELVADHEEAGQNRDAVLDAIDDRLDILEGVVAAPAAPVHVEAAAAPAKKASTKKASTKKAPARKVPAASERAATKRTPAKKAAATSAKAPARTPAKKAAATSAKAPARSTAKKAAAASAKAPARSTAKKAAAASAKAPARSTAKKAVDPAKKVPSTRKKSATTKRAAASGTAKKAAVKKVSAAKKAAKR